MKKVLIPVAVLAVAGGGFYGYKMLDAEADKRLKTAIEAWQKDLPAGSSFSYASADASIASQGVVFKQVSFTRPQNGGSVTLEAEQASISGGEFSDGRLTALGSFSFQGGKFTEDGKTTTIDSGSGADMVLAEDKPLKSVGELVLNGVTVPDTPKDATFDKITVRDASASGLGELVVQGGAFALKPDEVAIPMEIAFGEARIDGADFAEMAALAERGVEPSPEEIVAALRNGGLDNVSISDMTLKQAGETIGTLAGMEMSLSTDQDGTIRVSGSYEDSTQFVSAAPAMSGPFADLGYDKVVGDGRWEMSWNPEAGVFRIDEISAETEKLMDISISGEVVGLPPVQEAAGQLQAGGAQALGKKAALAAVEIRVVNHGLIERLADKQAKASGMSREQFMSQQAQMIRQASAQRGAQDFGEQMAEFVSSPKSLTLSLSPTQPVEIERLIMMAMIDPKRLQSATNLKLVAND